MLFYNGMQVIREGTYKGYTYYIAGKDYPCAYVSISKNNKDFYKVTDDSILDKISVHGGITWTRCRLPWQKEKEDWDSSNWYLGWDYVHADDGRRCWDGTLHGNKFWELPEIKKHCEEVIDQLISYDNGISLFIVKSLIGSTFNLYKAVSGSDVTVSTLNNIEETLYYLIGRIEKEQ